MDIRSTLTIPLGAREALRPRCRCVSCFTAWSPALTVSGDRRLGAGFVVGLVLARGVGERTTPRFVSRSPWRSSSRCRRVCHTAARVANVPPEMDASSLSKVRRYGVRGRGPSFINGQVTMDALAQLIDRTILPELGAARAHLKELGRVPRVHTMVAAADEYFRLREQSWRGSSRRAA